MTSLSIKTPGNYVPAVAIDFAAADGTATLVSAVAPLPVAMASGSGVTLSADAAATSTPLAGAVASTGTTLVGPFAPQLARDIWATIVGSGASGSAQLLRSTDRGASKLGITAGGQAWAAWSFSGASAVIVNEPVVTASDTATYYLSITLSAGSVTYRLGQ